MQIAQSQLMHMLEEQLLNLYVMKCRMLRITHHTADHYYSTTCFIIIMVFGLRNENLTGELL